MATHKHRTTTPAFSPVRPLSDKGVHSFYHLLPGRWKEHFSVSGLLGFCSGFSANIPVGFVVSLRFSLGSWPSSSPCAWCREGCSQALILISVLDLAYVQTFSTTQLFILSLKIVPCVSRRKDCYFIRSVLYPHPCPACAAAGQPGG